MDAQFSAWLAEHNVHLNGIEAGYVPEGYRGVLATRDLSPGEVILQVPERLLMSVHSAEKCEQMRMALTKCPGQLSSIQILAIHLIHEMCRGDDSFWALYLQQLPRSYTTFLNFATDDIPLLQVDYAMAAAEAAVEALTEQWREAKPALAALGLPAKWQSKAAWRWAAASISSRTMYLASDPAGALTPFGDLHNYEPPPPPFTPNLLGDSSNNGSSGSAGGEGVDPTGVGGQVGGDGRFDVATRHYHIIAGRRYKAGDQVFLCYGQHTNLELCEHYGFLLADNPHDAALLPQDLLQATVQHAELPSPAACLVHANGQPSWELLVALRRAAASPQEMQREGGRLLAEGRRISAAGDRQVMQWLAAVCSKQLSALPTTLGADEELLPTLDPEQCAALAVQWRIGYKRILKRCVAICEAGLQQLGHPGTAMPRRGVAPNGPLRPLIALPRQL